ncbi:MAG: dual specificity protein phosphatase family protein [Chloroflexi bacterium]|nr:dual specificity protein phosphatase family protein [Chloroflexota bacterium]
MISKVTNQVYIGDVNAAKARLSEFGITRILYLHEEPLSGVQDIPVVDRPIPDGRPISAETFDDFLAIMQGEIDNEGRVLVMCWAGMSRSATVVLAYLVSQGMGLREAYEHLRQQHPLTEPHTTLWQSLLDYTGLPHSMLDIMQWRIEGQA